MNDACCQLLEGDCLARMRELPDACVNLVLTDPPYHRLRGEAWDRQWSDDRAFIAWVGELCVQWRRLLKPNGSLYVFASPRMAARVEVAVGEHFQVLNHIVWPKRDYTGHRVSRPTQRAFLPASERIIFAEQYGAADGCNAASAAGRELVFEPLRAYLDGERRRAGVVGRACNAACASLMPSRHYFARSQWQLPTEQHYRTLQQLFNQRVGADEPREYLTREYDELRAEYEALRRTFEASDERPYTDVWTFDSPKGKRIHPCQKPLPMLHHILETSTKPGDLVLDCFAGSAATGVACLQAGRRFVGIERDPGYLDAARAWLAEQPAA